MKEAGELPGRVKVRSSRYLNNVIEQDHRRVKHRLGRMLGFKRCDIELVIMGEIELAERSRRGNSRWRS
jgi:transposase-like protein